jgi:hypothetical protein
VRLREDRVWLGVLAAVTAAEVIWWAIDWSAGIAPLPWLATYVGLAFAGLAAAFVVHSALRPRSVRASWLSLALGATLIGVGASFFLPLKYAIPKAIPFWLDGPLASAERALFGTDAWIVLDRLLGWALIPMDRIYGLWLPVQSLVLFTVMLRPPSRSKARALIAYSLAWLVLGVAAAAIFSSAGPIFYDRLFGGSEFAALRDTLHTRGAWMVLAESDAMWASLATGHPGFVAGISAFPSLHVAISLWIVLAARSMAPRARPFALCYFILISIASVQLGWHYVSDGLAGALGMLAIWFAAGLVERAINRPTAGQTPRLDAQRSPADDGAHRPDLR